MLEKCVNLNQLCWCNYGKLMYKLQNYNKAKQCDLKIQTEPVVLHYHFAKIQI